MPHQFQEEVRRALTKYALVPVTIFAVLGSLLMLFSWNHYVTDANHEKRAMVAEVMQGIFADYWQRTRQTAEKINAAEDLQVWQDNPAKRAELYSDLYHMVNIAHDGTQFYLADTAGTVLLGSQEELPPPLRPFQRDWGILYRLAKLPEQPAAEFVSRGDSGERDLLIGQAIVRQGKLAGWFFFLIPGEYLQRNIASGNVDFVLADSFGNAQVVAGGSYAVRMGKVTEPFASVHSGMVQAKDHEYYVTSEPFAGGPSGDVYTVYAISEATDLLRRYVLGAGLLLGIVLVMLPVILISVRRESRARAKAVEDLADAFAEAKAGRLDRRLAVHEGSELAIIEQEYNRMTESLQELMRQNEAETRASVISEVRQLESQFHPHFLFNTLENIKFMVKLDPEAAIQMIQALSALLRYSIREETRRVPLEKDLEYLHSYMKIQQFRFGQRLHYREQIDDRVRGCLIPKLLFQPVLENAIKYGEAEDGTIEIRFCVMALGDDLLASIEDKGRGMAPEVFSHLQRLLHGGENSSVHKGLYNVHRRIQLMFGTAYRLKLLQPSSGGTRIEMRLPRQEEL